MKQSLVSYSAVEKTGSEIFFHLLKMTQWGLGYFLALSDTTEQEPSNIDRF